MRGSLLCNVALWVLVAVSMAAGADTTQPTSLRTYFTIPVFGQLGREVTADAFSRAIDAGIEAKADYIVVLLDSDGGNLVEAERMITVLERHTGLKTIALVKKVMGPSVALSFACRRIYLHGEGTASLLLPGQLNGRQLTTEQAEQLRAALRRNLMEACKVAGREPLVALGMIEPDLDLYAMPGVPVRVGLRRAGPESQWIKRPGQFLTFDRSNAVQYGYAEGVCTTMDQIAHKMGLSDGWTSAGDGGGQIMRQAADAFRAEQEKNRFHREHAKEIDQIIGKIKAQRLSLQQVDQGLTNLDSQRKMLKRQAEDAYQQNGDARSRDASLDAIQQEYLDKRKRLTAAREQIQISLDADLDSLKAIQEKLK